METMSSMTRRTILASLAGAAAAPLLARGAAALETSGAGSGHLGIQLYMLGDEVDADLDGVLRQVAAIGYREVELPHFYGREPAVMRKALAEAGLACPSIHAGLSPIYPGMPAL